MVLFAHSKAYGQVCLKKEQVKGATALERSAHDRRGHVTSYSEGDGKLVTMASSSVF
jgi:hypothetical protein